MTSFNAVFKPLLQCTYIDLVFINMKRIISALLLLLLLIIGCKPEPPKPPKSDTGKGAGIVSQPDSSDVQPAKQDETENVVKEEKDNYVVQGYQFASASKGSLSSPTMTLVQGGGQFIKLDDFMSLLQLELGDNMVCRFKLPETAFDVKAVITYKVQNTKVKGRIRWNNSLFPENQAVLNSENAELTMKEIPLDKFQQENELKIFPETESIQILNIKILYKYRMPSCTVGDVTVKLLSPDSDKDELTPDLKLEWEGTGSCDKGWVTLKYKDGEEWKTVPGAESINVAWKEKSQGQFVWENHGLDTFPLFKIEYNDGESSKHKETPIDTEVKPDVEPKKRERPVTANQIADEAKEYFKKKQYDDALTKIDEALIIDPDNREYKNIKYRIKSAKADRLDEEAKDLLEKKQYNAALVKIQEALNMFPDYYPFKLLKQEIEENINDDTLSQNTSDNDIGIDFKRAGEFYQRAVEFYKARNYNDALKNINRALSFSGNCDEYIQFQKMIIASYNNSTSIGKDPVLSKGNEAGEAAEKVIKIGDEKIKFVFHWCPAGTFTMGSPENESGHSDDEIQHEVTLTKGFWIMEMEVTQRQWKAVMGNNPSKIKGDDLPVENVSWDDCQEFCKKCIQLGLPVSLPTEAQWEYACRAGTKGFYAGNLDDMAWYGDNSNDKTHLVGTKNPNAWGLYDMHGNVWEWCLDGYSKYPDDSITDPKITTNTYPVFRGGGWRDDAESCRSAKRNYIDRVNHFNYLGFRCVINPK